MKQTQNRFDIMSLLDWPQFLENFVEIHKKVNQTYEYLEKFIPIIDIHYENSNFPIFIP